MYAKGESFNNLFQRTTWGLFKIAIIPFTIIGFLGPVLFSLIFGNEWETSGRYAQIIAFWVMLGVINPPAIMSINILGLQKFFLIYELSMTVARFFSIYLSFIIWNDPYLAVLNYTMVGFSFNLLLIVFIYLKVKQVSGNF